MIRARRFLLWLLPARRVRLHPGIEIEVKLRGEQIVLMTSDDLHWIARLGGGEIDLLQDSLDQQIEIWVRPVKLLDTGVDAGP